LAILIFVVALVLRLALSPDCCDRRFASTQPPDLQNPESRRMRRCVRCKQERTDPRPPHDSVEILPDVPRQRCDDAVKRMLTVDFHRGIQPRQGAAREERTGDGNMLMAGAAEGHGSAGVQIGRHHLKA
jgi:hypothetical protein